MNNVFRKNSSKGRSREVPLSATEMLEEARTVMVKNGHNRIASAIGIEPYSGTWKVGMKDTAQPDMKPSMGSGYNAGRDRITKLYTQMTVKERAGLCCRNYNSSSGCNRTSCRYKHMCSKIDGNKVCWDKTHNLLTHP